MKSFAIAVFLYFIWSLPLTAQVQAVEPALRVEGAAGRDKVVKDALVFSFANLANMPHTSEHIRGRDGKERVYEGVLLSQIFIRAGQPLGEELRGSLLQKYVVVTAHDGYRVVFSLPEVDPAFTSARIIVADRVDGKLLPPREGPLRIIIPTEKREARWIRMVEKIEILSAPESAVGKVGN